MSTQLHFDFAAPQPGGFLAGWIDRFKRRAAALPAIVPPAAPVDSVPDTKADDAEDAEWTAVDFADDEADALPAIAAPKAASRKVEHVAAEPAPLTVSWFKRGPVWHLRATPKGRPLATVSPIREGKRAGQYRVVIKEGDSRPAWDTAKNVPTAKRLAADWYGMNRPHVTIQEARTAGGRSGTSKH